MVNLFNDINASTWLDVSKIAYDWQPFMDIIYTDKHRLRDAKSELYGGELVHPFERPSRIDYILSRLAQVNLGPLVDPNDQGIQPLLAIHRDDYVAFLQMAFEAWVAEGFKGEAIAASWPARRMSTKRPNNIDGLVGYYALAAETSITGGTWEAAYWSAQVAVTGADRLQNLSRTDAAAHDHPSAQKGSKGPAAGVFSLCRPPGHHATADMYGGYCFLNNAAIAAQRLRDQGARRVAVLDIDFHHGNGTQDIFYTREDVLFVSLHGDPLDAFPYYLGHADETGDGAGRGFTLNLPMPPGTTFDRWRAALAQGLDRIAAFDPDALVVSLGVDAFENDPISFFKLTSDDFTTAGADIAALQLPTLFVMEGGYDIDEIGINTVNVLAGFEGR